MCFFGAFINPQQLRTFYLVKTETEHHAADYALLPGEKLRRTNIQGPSNYPDNKTWTLSPYEQRLRLSMVELGVRKLMH